MKRLLFPSMLLLAAVAFTGEASAAGPCPHYFDAGTCNSDPECFWDITDGRCESRGGPTPGSCGLIHDKLTCSTTLGCHWDALDGRCE